MKGTLTNLRKTYGGKQYDYDYDTKVSMSDMAQRIMSDFRFDIKCKKNLEKRMQKNA